jgi:spermidine synthase
MNARAKRRRGAPKAATGGAPGQRPTARSVTWLLVAAATVLILGGALVVGPAIDREGAAAGTEPGLVTKVESLYNDIYLYRQTDGRFMLSFGAKRLRYVESIVNPNDALELPVYYTRSMVAGALAYPSDLKDAAIIGLGGGRTAWYLHKSVPELNFTAVELDPAVARIADRYFNVRPEPHFAIDVRDGRVFLARTNKQFDVILIDAYRGPFVPFHLLTKEFYQLVASRLKPGGVAVQNVEPSTMLFDSAVATIKAAFEHTVFLAGEGNIVIVAYNGPEKTDADVARLAAERQQKYGFRYDLPGLLKNRYEPTSATATAPLTDDFAPVEYLKAIERHNERQT